MDRSDWDARYAASDLVWGAEPNRFVEAELGAAALRGRALDLACGEGRNAIWLAERGWRVTAVDFSEVAIERGRKLAEHRGIGVEWRCEDLATYVPDAAAFELVLIAYLQVPWAAMQDVLARAARALAPSGELMMIGHARRNLEEGFGGPRHPSVLWDPGVLEDALNRLGLLVDRCEEVLRPVDTPDGPREAIDVLVRARQAA